MAVRVMQRQPRVELNQKESVRKNIRVCFGVFSSRTHLRSNPRRTRTRILQTRSTAQTPACVQTTRARKGTSELGRVVFEKGKKARAGERSLQRNSITFKNKSPLLRRVCTFVEMEPGATYGVDLFEQLCVLFLFAL